MSYYVPAYLVLQKVHVKSVYPVISVVVYDNLLKINGYSKLYGYDEI